MISGVYAPCTGFPFFRCGPLSSSTASRVEIPLEFLPITVPDASCVLPFWSCSNLFSTFLPSKQFSHTAVTIVSMVICPLSGRHECSRQPLTRKSPRSMTNVTMPRYFNNDLGGVEDRSVGDVAFQPISEGTKKTKKNSPCSNIFLLSEALSFVRLGSCETLYLRAEGVRRLTMQANTLGGSVLFFTFNQVVR